MIAWFYVVLKVLGYIASNTVLTLSSSRGAADDNLAFINVSIHWRSGECLGSTAMTFVTLSN